jgi:hypothetical protein
MESLVEGSREDCVEVRVQMPMRRPAPPTWSLATNVSNTKITNSPLKPLKGKIGQI